MVTIIQLKIIIIFKNRTIHIMKNKNATSYKLKSRMQKKFLITKQLASLAAINNFSK